MSMWPFKSDKTDTAQVEVPPPILHTQLASSSSPAIDEASDNASLLTVGVDPLLANQIRQPQRLGFNPFLRTLLIGGTAFASGFALGTAKGSTTSALRYRAENAHRTPTSKAGWYLYGKSRNYHAIIGGVTEGVKAGSRFFAWTALFIAIEEGLDRARGRIFARRNEDLAKGQRDVLNTVSAAVALAGIYSWKQGFDRFAASRMTTLALRFAVPYGIAQDVLASLRGDGPWYVGWVRKRVT